jgi:hypothetical protein
MGMLLLPGHGKAAPTWLAPLRGNSVGPSREEGAALEVAEILRATDFLVDLVANRAGVSFASAEISKASGPMDD